MSPIPLDFGAPERRRHVAAAIRRAVNDAVDSVGLGCAAGACGCEPPELREALDGKRGRRLPLEWAIAVCDVAGASYRLAVFAAILGPYDLEPRPARPMTDAEYARHLEDMVRDQLGAVGGDVVARAKREARRG